MNLLSFLPSASSRLLYIIHPSAHPKAIHPPHICPSSINPPSIFRLSSTSILHTSSVHSSSIRPLVSLCPSSTCLNLHPQHLSVMSSSPFVCHPVSIHPSTTATSNTTEVATSLKMLHSFQKRTLFPKRLTV